MYSPYKSCIVIIIGLVIHGLFKTMSHTWHATTHSISKSTYKYHSPEPKARVREDTVGEGVESSGG